MSLRATVKKAIDTAFIAAGDLVVTATFDNVSASGFVFSTGELTSTGEQAASVEMIPIETITEGNETTRTKFIARSIDFDYSTYSTFSIGVTEYQVASITLTEGLYQVEATTVT
jgi:hypothetical protein